MKISHNLLSKITGSAATAAVLGVFLFVLACCTGNNTPKEKSQRKTSANKHYTITSPSYNAVVKHGEAFEISLQTSEDIQPDSVALYLNNELANISTIGQLKYSSTIESPLVGTRTYKFQVFTNGEPEIHSIQLFVLPTQVPSTINYKVIRSFKHDPQAYTQGLLYRDGHLYESTGKKKQSSIRKINLETGEIVKKKSIDPELFGEGIAVVGKEIYMITYISQVGLVFDAVTFDVIRKFDLQTKEGWGLTTKNDLLILSDGSANLYYFEPEYFTLKKQIEVCDNKGLVSQINELEQTPYGLFANIYGEKHIVLINEETGVVKGILDLSELFPKDIPDNFEYVLNGIAYNPEADKFYVTGKQWPVIYELSLSID